MNRQLRSACVAVMFVLLCACNGAPQLPPTSAPAGAAPTAPPTTIIPTPPNPTAMAAQVQPATTAPATLAVATADTSGGVPTTIIPRATATPVFSEGRIVATTL